MPAGEPFAAGDAPPRSLLLRAARRFLRVARRQRATRPTLCVIDSPAERIVLDLPFKVSGWALAANGIRQVEARVAGLPSHPAIHGLFRPDVAAAHPDYPEAENSGYQTEPLTLSEASTDEITVSVLVTTSGGGGHHQRSHSKSHSVFAVCRRDIA